LGDIEECWLASINDILKEHMDTYLLERKFYLKNRYIKVAGNHDDIWYNREKVRSHLFPIFPRIQVYDSVSLNWSSENNRKIFLMHGHQGTFTPGTFSSQASRCAVSCCWKACLNCCNWNNTSYQTPATCCSTYQEFDKVVNEWVNENNIITITGHSHRPIIHSNNSCSKEIQEKYNIQIKDNIRYFNTGSCIYSDGSITGIEIHSDYIQLISFSSDGIEPIVLGKTDI
jgi:predicted phosphodiesterase